MTAGTAGTSPLAQAPPSWGGAQGASQQQGVPQQTPPRGPTRKEAAAVHDPFAALTGHQSASLCVWYSSCVILNTAATSACPYCAFSQVLQCYR